MRKSSTRRLATHSTSRSTVVETGRTTITGTRPPGVLSRRERYDLAVERQRTIGALGPARTPRPGAYGGSNGCDNSAATLLPRSSRDAETGRIVGIRNGPCRSCGHRTIISTASLLCGRQGCLQRRIAKATKVRS